MLHILQRGAGGEGVQGASFCFVLSQPPAPSSSSKPERGLVGVRECERVGGREGRQAYGKVPSLLLLFVLETHVVLPNWPP